MVDKKSEKNNEITNPNVLSEKQIFSFLESNSGHFSQYSAWLNRQPNRFQAAANTLRALHKWFSELPQFAALPDLVKFITEQFIADVEKDRYKKSVSIANIFAAASGLIDSIEALGSAFKAQKKQNHAQIQQKTFTWPFSKLLGVLANISEENSSAQRLSTKLSWPNLMACSRQFQGMNKSSTLEELGRALDSMGRLAKAQCLTGKRANVEFITQLAFDQIEEANKGRVDAPNTGTILSLLRGCSLLASQGYLSTPLQMDHVNSLLVALTDKELYYHQHMLVDAIMYSQQLFETTDKPSINGKDSLNIYALEEILCNFTETEPHPAALVDLLRALKSICNQINSPFKLNLKPLTDVLEQIDRQDSLKRTSIALGRVIGEALMYVGQIIQNRPYLSEKIDNSSLCRLIDNLQKSLFKIVASNPPDTRLIKYAIFSLSGASLMGKTSATETTRKLAQYVLEHLGEMKPQFSKDHYAANCNQLAHYLYLAGEPEQHWPKWLTDSIEAQKPKKINSFQEDLAKALRDGGFNVETEKGFGYTHVDVYAEKDGVRLAFEINGPVHVSSRAKIKKDEYRKKALEFRQEVDWVRNIDIWKDKFDPKQLLSLALDTVKELKNSKKEVKDQASEPLTKTKELYQYIIADSAIPSEEVHPEKNPSTVPAYKLPSITTSQTESSTPLVEEKRNHSEKIPAAVRRRKALPAYQLVEWAEQGNLEKIKHLLGAGTPKNPYTDKPDRYTLVVALMAAIQKESTGGSTGLKNVIEYLVNKIGPNELLLEKFKLSPWIVAHKGGEKTKWVSLYIEDFIYEKLKSAIIKETKKRAKQQKGKQKGKKLAPQSAEDLLMTEEMLKAKQSLKQATDEAQKLAITPVRARDLFREETRSGQGKATYKLPSQQESKTTNSTSGKVLFPEEALSQPVQDTYKPPDEQKLTSSASALDQYNLGTCYYKGIGVEKDAKEAAGLFESAANLGFAPAQFSLGMCYQTGEGVEENPAKAVNLYQLAAGQGDPLAQIHLGICYRDNIGVEQDQKKAVDLFKKAAEQENPEAQFHLGLCYKNGSGLNTDLLEAARLFQLAAEQGNLQAQCHLGLCYEKGEGVDKNQQRAVRLFESGVQQGNANSQYHLGLCYQKGVGVKKNQKEATRLFMLAAEQGNLEAFDCLSYNQRQESKPTAPVIIVKIDSSKSAALIKMKNTPRKSTANLIKLSDKGDVDAKYELGKRYLDPKIEDFGEAYRLIESAACEGHEKAKLYIKDTEKMWSGIGISETTEPKISRNKLDNKKEYTKELTKDNLKGRIENICQIFLKDDMASTASMISPSFQKNIKDTITILKQHSDSHRSELKQSTLSINDSADSKPLKGYSPNLCGNYFDKVANLFMEEPDNSDFEGPRFKPFKQFALALVPIAEQGNQYAQYGLACCYQMRFGVKENWQKSVQYLHLAAEQGHLPSQIRLGDCFYMGYGLGKDAEKALNWYKKAIQQPPMQNKSQEASERGIFLNVSQLLAEELMDQFHDGSNNVGRPEVVIEAVNILQSLGKFNYEDLPPLLQKRKKIIANDDKEKFLTAVCSLVMKKSNQEGEGNEAKESIKKALDRLINLAEFGDSNAQYTLALFFAAVQFKQGKDALLNLAAINKNPQAQIALGQCTSDRIEKNYWFGQAILQKNAVGIIEMAKLNCDREPTTAVEFYKKAACRGNVDGLVLLARAYYEDILVDQDVEKAVKLARLVIEQGAADKLPIELLNITLNESEKNKNNSWGLGFFSSSTASVESTVTKPKENDKQGAETLPTSIARPDTLSDKNLLGERFRVFGSSPSNSIAETSPTSSNTIASQDNEGQTTSPVSSNQTD